MSKICIFCGFDTESEFDMCLKCEEHDMAGVNDSGEAPMRIVPPREFSVDECVTCDQKVIAGTAQCNDCQKKWFMEEVSQVPINCGEKPLINFADHVRSGPGFMSTIEAAKPRELTAKDAKELLQMLYDVPSRMNRDQIQLPLMYLMQFDDEFFMRELKSNRILWTGGTSALEAVTERAKSLGLDLIGAPLAEVELWDEIAPSATRLLAPRKLPEAYSIQFAAHQNIVSNRGTNNTPKKEKRKKKNKKR